jgi:hypothetical protein
VRQELKMLDDFVPEGDLVEIELNEMPGLQNTGRILRMDMPLGLEDRT